MKNIENISEALETCGRITEGDIQEILQREKSDYLGELKFIVNRLSGAGKVEITGENPKEEMIKLQTEEGTVESIIRYLRENNLYVSRAEFFPEGERKRPIGYEILPAYLTGKLYKERNG